MFNLLMPQWGFQKAQMQVFSYDDDLHGHQRVKCTMHAHWLTIRITIKHDHKKHLALTKC